MHRSTCKQSEDPNRRAEQKYSKKPDKNFQNNQTDMTSRLTTNATQHTFRKMIRNQIDASPTIKVSQSFATVSHPI
ncbi:hypothetical protein HanHA300_Chr04g0125151 [Helianthus annuus]|nr:hypothetical protein HanHA300_Chr04g0125151 [Helianthus annuus]KAJ0595997.1 hypothetical protein HanHA89_Chr04g0137721 [Helianthus annuus]KAJ0756639.1 hypothetical protein HanLR1_Chr04g0129401 [Helianthus annuus]